MRMNIFSYGMYGFPLQMRTCWNFHARFYAAVPIYILVFLDILIIYLFTYMNIVTIYMLNYIHYSISVLKSNELFRMQFTNILFYCVLSTTESKHWDFIFHFLCAFYLDMYICFFFGLCLVFHCIFEFCTHISRFLNISFLNTLCFIIVSIGFFSLYLVFLGWFWIMFIFLKILFRRRNSQGLGWWWLYPGRKFLFASIRLPGRIPVDTGILLNGILNKLFWNGQIMWIYFQICLKFDL